MALAGYAPEDVTVIVLTHFHGDHIYGLMAGGKPTFPNARYVVGRKEFDWWTSDEAKNGNNAEDAATAERLIVPLKDKMTFVAEGDTVAPGVTAIEAFGHTLGNLIFAVESEGKRLWITGDTANHYVAALQKPEWQYRYDMDKDMAIATRKRVFDQIAESRILFTGYHMPFPAIGYAEKTEDGGYHFIPETYQLAVDMASAG